MTTEQSKEYKAAVERIALEYGFHYTGHGCMCSGGQLLYNTNRGRSTLQIAVWDRRGYWHLYENRTKIAFGTEPETLKNQLKQLWALSD